MTEWIFHQPKLEYKSTLAKSLNAFGWVGHVNFAYDLVSYLKPKVIVELGTHWGVSFFSFCQAVKDNSPPTQLYAIDTWVGEKHTGFYGEKVITKVREIRDKFFRSLKIKLIRKTFDNALADFENHSIDLLHIDGLHTYEAVRHDLESWLPKLKKNGIVLMHDTSEVQRGFGVYKLWEELNKSKDHTFELTHSHGLGILCRNEQAWKVIKPLRQLFSVYYRVAYEKEEQVEDYQRRMVEVERRMKQIESIIRENIELCGELLRTEEHLRLLEKTLDNITTSKFYKLWSFYNRLKLPLKPSRHD